MSINQAESFSIIETILWENNGFFLLDRHLGRLEKSAKYFSYRLSMAHALTELQKMSGCFTKNTKYKVRLLLDKSGTVALSSSLLDELPEEPLKVTFATAMTDKNDVLYRHKTTARLVYDRTLAACRGRGYFDSLFMNTDGEITEGWVTNVIIRKEKAYITPPVECGLLNGVYRQYLIDTGEMGIKEKVLRREDILSADEILLVNSVRKKVRVVLSD